MQDKELYQQILGLSSPWSVADVQLDLAAQEVQCVWSIHDPPSFAVPFAAANSLVMTMPKSDGGLDLYPPYTRLNQFICVVFVTLSSY